MAGEKLSNFNLNDKSGGMYAVKEAVFPFNKFPNSDLLLGPEMKSTGEVMGFDKDFGLAFAIIFNNFEPFLHKFWIFTISFVFAWISFANLPVAIPSHYNQSNWSEPILQLMKSLFPIFVQWFEMSKIRFFPLWSSKKGQGLKCLAFFT